MSFIGKFLFHIGATAVVFWFIENYVLPEKFVVIGEAWWAYAVVALIFGLMNFWVKPFVKLAMLPLNILTLGFASLAVNGLLLIGLQYFLTVYDIYGVTLSVEGWLSYFIAGLVMTAAHTVIHWVS